MRWWQFWPISLCSSPSIWGWWGRSTFVRRTSQAHKKGLLGNRGISEAEPKRRFCELQIWRCSAEMENQNPGLGEPLAFPIYILSEQWWKPHIFVTFQPMWLHYAYVKVPSPKGLQWYCWSQCRYWYGSSNERRVWVAILIHPFNCQDHLWSPESKT